MCGNGCVQQKHFADFEQLHSNLNKFNTKAIKFLVFSPNHPLSLPQKKPADKNIFQPSPPSLIPNIILTLKCFHCTVVDHNEDYIILLFRSDLRCLELQVFYGTTENILAK